MQDNKQKLFNMIKYLCTFNGECIATSKYFSLKLNRSIPQVERYIKQLKKENKINVLTSKSSFNPGTGTFYRTRLITIQEELMTKQEAYDLVYQDAIEAKENRFNEERDNKLEELIKNFVNVGFPVPKGKDALERAANLTIHLFHVTLLANDKEEVLKNIGENLVPHGSEYYIKVDLLGHFPYEIKLFSYLPSDWGKNSEEFKKILKYSLMV